MNLLKKLKIVGSIALLLSTGLTIAADTDSALKTDNMRFEPYADAKVVGSVSRGESLQIIKKQGAWLQVKTKKNVGWVRLLSVKRGATTANSGTNIAALTNGRAGTGQIVSTTGIRGLNEQELKAAKFNETEINTLENFAQTAEQAKQFANAGQLKMTSLATIKAPKTNSAGAAK